MHPLLKHEVHRTATGLLFVAFALASLSAAEPPADNVAEPAFKPEGFGARAIGGKGGKVIWVTNRNDDGPGSFRAAVMAKGPRIVKFRIGGIIPLRKPIRLSHGRITIDGISAVPHGGVTLTGGGIQFEGLTCRDVIVRNIRIRGASDALGVGEGAHRVLIDHCSLSWARDENVGINKGHYVTVQWCIISEGHREKGRRGFGMLVAHGANHVTIHHNLFTGNHDRNALLYGVGGGGKGGAVPGMYPGEKYAQYMPNAVFDFRNNVIYNFAHGTKLDAGVHVNVVNNVYRRGPQAKKTGSVVVRHRTFYPGTEHPKLYCSGNLGRRRPTQKQHDWALVYVNDRGWGLAREHCSDRPFFVPPVETHAAEGLAELLLRKAGAHPRDDVDQRLIREYRTGKGKIGGGYTAWKKKHGLR